MIITWSPILTVSELAIGATTTPEGTRSSVSRDRSAAGSEAVTRATTVSPPMNSTLFSSIACTTRAAAVSMGG